MKTKNRSRTAQERNGSTLAPPSLKVAKIGVVTRDERRKYANGYKDFSHSLPGVLALLDQQGCDVILFSLSSVLKRPSFDPRTCFKQLRNVKAVLLEEFTNEREEPPERYVVYHRTSQGWNEYSFMQQFGSLSDKPKPDVGAFVRDEIPKRVLGDCCVLLCGETNAVKYSRGAKEVQDASGLVAAIPAKVRVILNPIHDRMTRLVKPKRQFLSKNGRWVVSVWNKGKVFKDGKTRDGAGPAWTVFHNGEEIQVPRIPIPDELGVEIGVLECRARS